VWGCPRSYLTNIKNEQLEPCGARDSIDKMLIDMGIPVDMLNWFEEDDRNFQYAPVDEESRQTLNELKRIRDQALKVEDYEALK
jgi:centrosomal protein CEP104